MDLVSTKCSILGPEAKENEIQNIWSSPEGGLERVGLQGWETRSWIVNSNFFPGVVYIIEIRITIPSCRLLLRLASPSRARPRPRECWVYRLLVAAKDHIFNTWPPPAKGR